MANYQTIITLVNMDDPDEPSITVSASDALPWRAADQAVEALEGRMMAAYSGPPMPEPSLNGAIERLRAALRGISPYAPAVYASDH